MELSAIEIEALQQLGTTSDQVFVPLVKGTMGVVAEGLSEQDALGAAAGAAGSQIQLKSGYDAVQAVILEGARLNLDADAMRAYLMDEGGFAGPRADAFAKLFDKVKPALRARLAAVSSCTLDQVVEVDWRLDYHMKGDSLERVNQLVYLVKLKTRGNVPLSHVRASGDSGDAEEGERNPNGELQFSCTVDQLQDLVGKLKDAVKQMERSGAIA